jgi:hypothetical protein
MHVYESEELKHAGERIIFHLKKVRWKSVFPNIAS